MAGMGLPRAGGNLVLAVPSWFPGHVDYVCLFLKPGCHKVQRPLGLGLWSEGWLSLPCLAALLGLGLWDTTSSGPACPPCFVAFSLSLPSYPSLYFLLTLAWAGGRSGSGYELISSNPGAGCGCGAGRRGHPFLLCL